MTSTCNQSALGDTAAASSARCAKSEFRILGEIWIATIGSIARSRVVGSARRPAQQRQEHRVGAVQVRPELDVFALGTGSQIGNVVEVVRGAQQFRSASSVRTFRTIASVSSTCGEQVT